LSTVSPLFLVHSLALPCRRALRASLV